jgi:beta-N-acetylhexosaminidase
MNRAFITGLAGLSVTADERTFLREAAPWGLILFKRNIDTPIQVSRIIEETRVAIGADVPVLIDQEGGRVQRLGPPHWPAYPPGAVYGRIYQADRTRGLRAARLGARLIAADLKTVGIDVDCLPLADVPADGADAVIGDRAYGTSADQVAALAGAIAGGLADGGVLPVLKHLPGHGRATVDSHHKLPVVTAARDLLEATDFAAFRPLGKLPLGMTAHVVFTSIDPGAPATTSAIIIEDVIRDSVGFTGALMSDDISMGALTGTIAERTRAALAAGCDLILHCNGRLDEMEKVATEAPALAGRAAERAARALAARRHPDDIDLHAARAEFAALLPQPASGQQVAAS